MLGTLADRARFCIQIFYQEKYWEKRPPFNLEAAKLCGCHVFLLLLLLLLLIFRCCSCSYSQMDNQQASFRQSKPLIALSLSFSRSLMSTTCPMSILDEPLQRVEQCVRESLERVYVNPEVCLRG